MDMEEVVVPSVTRRLRNMAVCKRLQLQTRGAFQLVEFMTEAEKVRAFCVVLIGKTGNVCAWTWRLRSSNTPADFQHS